MQNLFEIAYASVYNNDDDERESDEEDTSDEEHALLQIIRKETC